MDLNVNRGVNMKCPYCDSEMKKGYIQSSYPIAWTPRKLKFFTFSAFYAEDSCVLADVEGIAAACAIAYNCEKCKKVIISYEENNEK